MTDATYSAGSVHRELAQMAWEELNRNAPDTTDPITLLQFHLRTMGEILSDPERYSQLWQRVKRGSA